MSELCGTPSTFAPTTRYAAVGFMLAALIVAGPAMATESTSHCPAIGIHTNRDGTYPLENRVAKLAWLHAQANYDYKAHAKTLTHTFFPKQYSATESNEFKIHALVSSCVKQIKKAVANLKTPVSFNLNTQAKVGKYDFSKKAFPLTPYKASAVFSIPYQVRGVFYQPDHGFELKITNPKLVQTLSMPQKKAENWINSRSQGSVIDRTVTLHARVVATGFEAPPKGFTSRRNAKNSFMDTRLVHVVVTNNGSSMQKPNARTLATYKAKASNHSNG